MVKLGHEQTKSIEAASKQAQRLGQEHSDGTPLVPPTEHEPELSTSTLDSELTDKESVLVDHALDPMALHESSTTDLVITKPLISVQEAQAKLSPNILKVLSEKFKGSLTEVRHKHEQDQIF